MTDLARQHPEASCTMFLEEEEWHVLYCISNRTSLPPSTPPTIKEAVLYLAKLGGFLGRKGDGDPGVKVILERIQSAPYHTEVLYVPTSIIRVCCGSSIAYRGGSLLLNEDKLNDSLIIVRLSKTKTIRYP